MKRYARIFPILLLPAAVLMGCGRDYYSEVVADCDYDSFAVPEPWTVKKGEAIPINANHSRLKEACKQKLESMIHYDDESFKDAPRAGIKDLITLAFQRVLAYPLKFPPQNRIIGRAPFSFSLWFVDIAKAEENPNKSLFNWILNSDHLIKYERTTKRQSGATTDASRAEIKFHDIGFFNEDCSIGSAYNCKEQPVSGNFESFLPVIALVHESFHTLNIDHDFSGLSDVDFTGAYGAQIAYLEMLLHGLAAPKYKLDPKGIASRLCVTLKQVSTLPPDLKSLDCKNLDELVAEDWAH